MKWYGTIAFLDQVDRGDGVWKPTITEREYYGDVIDISKRDQVTEINPDITLQNQLSVVADPFLLNSFSTIAYVTFMGQKWRVSSVKVGYPRLTLSFGSLYKEEKEEKDEQDRSSEETGEDSWK